MRTRNRTALDTPDRRAVALLLAEHGPLLGDEAADRLGWNSERWWAVISRVDDWFELTGGGWVLTPVGQVEFAELDLPAVNE